MSYFRWVLVIIILFLCISQTLCLENDLRVKSSLALKSDPHDSTNISQGYYNVSNINDRYRIYGGMGVAYNPLFRSELKKRLPDNNPKSARIFLNFTIGSDFIINKDYSLSPVYSLHLSQYQYRKHPDYSVAIFDEMIYIVDYSCFDLILKKKFYQTSNFDYFAGAGFGVTKYNSHGLYSMDINGLNSNFLVHAVYKTPESYAGAELGIYLLPGKSRTKDFEENKTFYEIYFNVYFAFLNKNSH